MSASDGPVALAIADGVASIVLRNPARGNAIDLAMARALADASANVAERPGIGCVLLSAEGRFFCVGGDLARFAEAGEDTPALLEQVTASLHLAILKLALMEKPLVVAINGPAAGAGVGLTALGDIVVAARSAHFSLAYTAAGLTPDGGATYLLPRLIGLRRTQELLLTNRRVAAEEAADIGLLTQVVDDDKLMSESAAIAARLAAGPTSAFAAVRRLLVDGPALEAQLAREARTICEASATPAGREGIRAFVEKRKPVFSGLAAQA